MGRGETGSALGRPETHDMGKIGRVARCAWMLLTWAWLKPKALERRLRQQGLKGNSYRLLYGDMKDMSKMNEEATSKPCSGWSADDLSDRVVPFLKHTVESYGSDSLIWSGPVPLINILEPKFIREVLLKMNLFRKPNVNPVFSFLLPGIINYEGEMWTFHRRLINPAFHIHKLKVTMILQEVLRIYPPFVQLNRLVHEDIKLGKYTLPAGILVNLPIILLQHDNQIWGDDAKEFNPERFSKGVLEATKGKAVSYFPFGWGPRICIGQNFSLIEAKLAVAMILRSFSLELSPSYIHAPCTVITLRPQFGAQVILRRL
ncbi:hypothetical protein Droror1_Dr00027306 [Drosera rotundifolia]